MKSWSLQNRLALILGISMTVLWLGAALLTAQQLTHRMNEVFDDGLQSAAARLLPLAIHDLRGGDERENPEVLALPDQDETTVYQLMNANGQVLLQSPGAAMVAFPAYFGPGFKNMGKYRFFQRAVEHGKITISVAEPLAARGALARKMMLELSMPLLIVLPLSLFAIAFVVRLGFAPLRALGNAISRRGAQDLSPLSVDELPRELQPFAAEVNDLFGRLGDAFEAERSFAANAAHELRTPVAGAIAQSQRLRAETGDENVARRAGEIETTLKRLMRASEKLMQLARAEGGRMRLESARDVRPVVKIVVDDFLRAGQDRCRLSMPESEVMSVIEPDVFGILCRNLIENALRHGDPKAPVEIDLSPAGVLTVSNEGPALPPETLERLGKRFQRGHAEGEGTGEGTGLGLAIVSAICERAEAEFSLVSPAPGKAAGTSARVALPRG